MAEFPVLTHSTGLINKQLLYVSLFNQYNTRNQQKHEITNTKKETKQGNQTQNSNTES